MAGDLKLVEPRRRRRLYPRRHADELEALAVDLESYYRGTAPNRQMQIYAMGARDALNWAVGGQFSPMASLSCTEMALRFKPRKGRSRLQSVPVFVRTTRRDDA